jgi:hypothetical protein
MVKIWSELSILFDNQAARRFGSVGDKVFIEWLNKLSGFSDEQLKSGLTGCLKKSDNYAPSLKEFIGYCCDEAKGLTHNTAAYKEVDPRKLLRHKCDPEKANDALAEMKAKLGMKS